MFSNSFIPTLLISFCGLIHLLLKDIYFYTLSQCKILYIKMYFSLYV